MKGAFKIIIFLALGLALTGAVTGPAFAMELPSAEFQQANVQLLQQQQGLTLKPNGAYWRNCLNDTAYILTAPTRWQRTDWLKASIVTGTALLLVLSDEQIREVVQTKRNRISDGVANLFSYGGELQFILPGLGLLYLYGSINGEDKPLQAGLYGLESLVITSGLTYTLKLLGHRCRPGAGDSGAWDGPGLSFDDAHLSFPSGHSALAFSTAGIIAAVYGEDNWLAPVLAYGIAGLTAWSRVNDDQHWASDIFVGSVLGYFTARAVARRHLQQAPNLSLWPSWNGEGVGFNCNYRF